MQLIDFHVHVGTKYHWTPWVMSFFQEQNPEYIDNFAEEVSPAEVLKYLDGQGVDRAVILAEYAPETTGVVTNEFVAGFCRESGQLMPFGALNLSDEIEPAVQAERCIRELGCRGLKFLPTYVHFYPDDPRLLPAYEVAQDCGVPVMFHTGTSIFKGSRIKYGNPLLLDEVAEDFPNLSIVMSHAGRPFWYAEAEWMLRRHKNTHIDLSGIPPKRLPSVFPHLEKLRDRFVFGSDWPGIPSIAAQAHTIRELPFSPRTIDAILWENAAKLLGM